MIHKDDVRTVKWFYNNIRSDRLVLSGLTRYGSNLRLEGRLLIPSFLKSSSVPSDDCAPPSKSATAIISLSPFETRTGRVRR